MSHLHNIQSIEISSENPFRDLATQCGKKMWEVGELYLNDNSDGTAYKCGSQCLIKALSDTGKTVLIEAQLLLC